MASHHGSRCAPRCRSGLSHPSTAQAANSASSLSGFRGGSLDGGSIGVRASPGEAPGASSGDATPSADEAGGGPSGGAAPTSGGGAPGGGGALGWGPPVDGHPVQVRRPGPLMDLDVAGLGEGADGPLN